MENPVVFQRETRPKEGWWRLASAFYWLVSIVFGLASFAVFSLCYTLVADKLGFGHGLTTTDTTQGGWKCRMHVMSCLSPWEVLPVVLPGMATLRSRTEFYPASAGLFMPRIHRGIELEARRAASKLQLAASLLSFLS